MKKEIRTRKFRVHSNLLVHVWMSRDMLLLLSSFLENLNKSGIKVISLVCRARLYSIKSLCKPLY